MKLSWDADWHVGTSALLGYYSSFDFTNRQLKLHPLTGGAKQQIEMKGSKPDIKLGDDTLTIVILSLSNAFVVTLLVLLCLAVYFNKNVFSPEDDQDASAAVEPAPEEPSAENADAQDATTTSLLRKSKVSGHELEALLQRALAKRGI